MLAGTRHRYALVEIQNVYTEFFGLNEKPFSISPDPRYLYLSRRHADALAHLIYGISESGGFIQLTGEVGTGKTTLVRSLLGQLPEKAEIALILNPQLSTKEFLQVICEELRIGLASDDSVKSMIDRLNKQLLLAHAEGRRIVLIVDEAQTLSPDLLEQVRLLTNLETAKKKLLQIILIGQPELRELLDRLQMRQIAQRITGRYHLEPLTYRDTALYVEHRLKIAGAQRPIFTRSAIRQLYRRSRGIPRLINVVADRALLAAYTQDRTRINGRLVRLAAAEVFGKRRRQPWWPWAVGAGGLAAFAFSTSLIPPSQEPTAPPQERASAIELAESRTARGAPAEPGDRADAREALAEVLAAAGDATNRDSAVAVLLSLWDVVYTAGNISACDQAVRAGLSCRIAGGGSLGQLRRINRPALLTLQDEDGREHHVIMTGLDYDEAEITVGDETHRVSVIDLTHHWYGEHLLLWRPALAEVRDLRPGSVDDGVTWLRDSLAKIRGVPNPDPQSRVYDDTLEAWVRDYQRERRLTVDGIAGERTQIAITSELRSGDEPALFRAH